MNERVYLYSLQGFANTECSDPDNAKGTGLDAKNWFQCEESYKWPDNELARKLSYNKYSHCIGIYLS